MRILHLLSQTELTGAEVYAKNLIEQQVKDGHQVLVVSDKIHVPLPVPWIAKPISLNKWRIRSQNAQFVRDLILSRNIDVLHAHSRASVRVAAKARQGLQAALVSTIHGRQHLSWGKKLKDIYGEYKILVCDNLKKQFQEELRVQPGSLKVVRNPFPFPALPLAKRPLQKRMAFVGRSSGPKGRRLQQLFEGGLFTFLRKHPDWKFDLICSQPQAFGEKFLSQLKTWEIKDQIQIRDSVTQLSSELNRYDLILGAGRVAVESLCQGCSVISFGEYTSHGEVSLENLKDNLASNFGDMGADAHEGPMNLELILSDLETFLSGKADFTADNSLLLEQLREDFEESRIHQEVIATYKAAIFKRNVPLGIPCLMYHKIPQTAPQTRHRIFVTANDFRKHLHFFSRQKFQTLHFSEIAQFWNQQKPYSEFPKKPLCLTFDDGYRDNLSEALPLLKAFNFKATLFLLADTSITENTWDLGKDDKEPRSELMTPDERKAIADSVNFEIGSHGLSHANFTTLNDSQVLFEMIESKKRLEAELNLTIAALAYPFGAVDARMPKLAAKAGYPFAVNTDQGGLHFADAPWSIFRVNIFPEENSFSLWKKTSSWYRQRFYKKHGK